MAGTVAVSQIQFDNGAGNTVTMMAPSSNQTYTFTLPSANTGALLVANNIVQLAAGSAGGPSVTANTDTASGLFFPAASTVAFSTASTERMRIDSSGNLQFNSGYGSVATAYGCRAWVNFNGTSTVAIRASGNVSSITDNGTGDYTVNFTTAMPDGNYSVVTCNQTIPGPNKGFTAQYEAANPATGSCRVVCFSNGATTTTADPTYFFASFFR